MGKKYILDKVWIGPVIRVISPHRTYQLRLKKKDEDETINILMLVADFHNFYDPYAPRSFGDEIKLYTALREICRNRSADQLPLTPLVTFDFKGENSSELDDFLPEDLMIDTDPVIKRTIQPFINEQGKCFDVRIQWFKLAHEYPPNYRVFFIMFSFMNSNPINHTLVLSSDTCNAFHDYLIDTSCHSGTNSIPKIVFEYMIMETELIVRATHGDKEKNLESMKPLQHKLYNHE